MALYKSFFTVGFLTIVSRVVGFVREILIAKELGAGIMSDAIKIAIKLPSLFRRIFAEGAFNASFVPMFADLLAKPDGKKSALSFAEHILSWLCLSLILLVCLVEFLMPTIFNLLFSDFDAQRLSIAIAFTRITFPFILFISLTAFYSGILNSLEKFVCVASSPAIGNIFIVGFVMFTNTLNNDAAFNFTVAVLGCGIVQLLWVWVPAFQSGYRLRFVRPTLTPKVRQFFKRLAPAAFGAGVVQINILIDTVIASRLPAGFISYLDFAERLNQLPLSVIGTAISTVLLPLMSKHISKGDIHDSMKTQNDSISFALLLTMPSMCGLIIWATPIVGMLYQYGKFTYVDTEHTAAALHAFAFGLPAYILIKIFATTFFAHKDTKTPVQVAIGTVLLNLILNLILIQSLKHVGLALATAISAWVNAFILAYILKKRGLFILDRSLGTFLYRLFLSIAIGMPFLFIARHFLMPFVSYDGWFKSFIMLFAVVFGFSIFILSAIFTKALDRNQFKMHMKSIIDKNH